MVQAALARRLFVFQTSWVVRWLFMPWRGATARRGSFEGLGALQRVRCCVLGHWEWLQTDASVK